MMIQAIVALTSVAAMGMVGMSMTERAHQATALPLSRAIYDEAVTTMKFALADSSDCAKHLKPLGAASFNFNSADPVDAQVTNSEGVGYYDIPPRGTFSLSGLNFKKQHQLSVLSPYGAAISDGTRYFKGELRITANRVAPAILGSPEIVDVLPLLLQFDLGTRELVSCSLQSEFMTENLAENSANRTALACLDNGGTPEPTQDGYNAFYCRRQTLDTGKDPFCPLHDPADEEVEITPPLLPFQWNFSSRAATGKIGVACE
jgi:hypothetical protein